MTIFTGATLAALITSDDCGSPAVAPVKVGISHHGSALNALAIHDNVTERRYAPMSTAKAFDPCCTFGSTAASTLRASVRRDGPILECELPIRGLGSLVDEDARVRLVLVEPRDATVVALVAEEAGPECVLRAMEDEDDPALSDCVAATWDGAGG